MMNLEEKLKRLMNSKITEDNTLISIEEASHILTIIYELKAYVVVLSSIPHVCGGVGCAHCKTLDLTPYQYLNQIKALAAIELAGIFHDGKWRSEISMEICEEYAKELRDK